MGEDESSGSSALNFRISRFGVSHGWPRKTVANAKRLVSVTLVPFRKPPALLVRTNKAVPFYKDDAPASVSEWRHRKPRHTRWRVVLVLIRIRLLLGAFRKPPAMPVVAASSTSHTTSSVQPGPV